MSRSNKISRGSVMEIRSQIVFFRTKLKFNQNRPPPSRNIQTSAFLAKENNFFLYAKLIALIVLN